MLCVCVVYVMDIVFSVCIVMREAADARVLVCLLVCRGCSCCGDCGACTVVCVEWVFSARLLVCEGDGSAGVGFRGGVVAVSAYMGGTRGSCVLASAGDVLEISVVRGEWLT